MTDPIIQAMLQQPNTDTKTESITKSIQLSNRRKLHGRKIEGTVLDSQVRRTTDFITTSGFSYVQNGVEYVSLGTIDVLTNDHQTIWLQKADGREVRIQIPKKTIPLRVGQRISVYYMGLGEGDLRLAEFVNHNSGETWTMRHTYEGHDPATGFEPSRATALRMIVACSILFVGVSLILGGMAMRLGAGGDIISLAGSVVSFVAVICVLKAFAVRARERRMYIENADLGFALARNDLRAALGKG